MKKILSFAVLFLLACILAVAGFGYYLVDDKSTVNTAAGKPQAEQVTRGEYLVKAGNCMGCHTARGEAAFAGGRLLQTDFGNFRTPNITPDAKTGIGNWTADDFWQALHNGKSRDGSLLYPSFPYTNYTQVSRADADVMYAYLMSLPKVEKQNQAHELRFPYDQRALLAFWRAAYFRPASYQEDKSKSVEWNRGAYLVNGLGHCSACHSSRNSLGANAGVKDLSGGELSSWYAPALTNSKEVNLAKWSPQELIALLKSGVNQHTAVSGPMAEVVAGSTQYLSDADIKSMVSYLQAIPTVQVAEKDMLDKFMAGSELSAERMDAVMKQGGALYKTHCMDCHGAQGEGVTNIYPALKSNPGLLSHALSNPVRMILSGGFPPVTKDNPRPYGMPPFAHTLTDSEVALVLSYVRNAWGNKAEPVTPAEVNRYRTAAME
ncbi:cytochrome c [Undibacterium sp. YM2]|uniref:c-type cytochrome n=1 Tax=Undibacterium sp. YM2 TaxID=2058625 RepID=UPI001331CCA6|nr:cytochrome c [Undibacterium sp. YM2]BBB67451.1 cytochrome c [Undibacterium sp. YM2]